MKALTICVPYCSLILLPASNPHHKRVENRSWPTDYRGPLLIHSGKSKQWMGTYNDDVEAYLPVHFGKIVGVVDVIDSLACFDVEHLLQTPHLIRKHPWLLSHQHHLSGPYCHVYANVRRFVEPIEYRGSQAFFHVPDSVVAKALEQAVAVD